ncbi:hypothetical protein RJ639_021355 [Escallonia herrerae]|uniref:Transposase (putative) gypsy type domain-containing protein n=1 Tax=Escallonia herrerae TaxID=1293975 RepID=A0AA88V5C3_9ASTE|nr:hypothetical protein RJ639_021355 [Escallonia herrerae]
MFESPVCVSSFEENIAISNSSSSRSDRVSNSRSEVGTSNPQLPQPSSSEPLLSSSSQPPQALTFQPSPSLPAKNALGDVNDQAKDEANPKPWYMVDEKSSKMSTEDLVELLQEYPLPEGCYARLPGLQELSNYGTKYETGIYEEQVRSGYGLPLHPFALHFFEHYHMAPGQLVPNGWRKLVGLIYLVQTSSYKPDATDVCELCTLCMRVGLKCCLVLRWRGKWQLRRLSRKGRPSRRQRKEAEEVTRRAEELSKQETGYLAQIETLERRLERAKRRVAEEVKKARDQGIGDFLDGNAGDEWLKKRVDDSLEIYELGFTKTKEMFAERFPDIPINFCFFRDLDL